MEDDAGRRELLTYVFVGAGYAGVEGFAELQDFAADALERYPRAPARRRALHARRGARADHDGDPGDLAEFASAELRRRGMEIRTRRRWSA